MPHFDCLPRLLLNYHLPLLYETLILLTLAKVVKFSKIAILVQPQLCLQCKATWDGIIIYNHVSKAHYFRRVGRYSI